MTDKWKHQYADSWNYSNDREDRVANKLVEDVEGVEVAPFGLGAMSTEFLSGSAESNGSETGSPDLHIVDTTIYIEVTGPQNQRVKPHVPLWLRPDKVRYAIRHAGDKKVFVVHELPFNNLLRVIPLGKKFRDTFQSNGFGIATPTIRGMKETYLEIPARSSHVLPWDALLLYIKRNING